MCLCGCVRCVKLWKYQEHFSNFSARRSHAQLTPPGGSPFSDSTFIMLHSSKCQHLLKAVRVTEERQRDSAGQGELHISEKGSTVIFKSIKHFFSYSKKPPVLLICYASAITSDPLSPLWCHQSQRMRTECLK